MKPLPLEILEKIFSELPRQDLLSVGLVERTFHRTSLALLYRRIQEIQLFGWGEHAHTPSIKCLKILAVPGNNPQAVRHFAVRGIPWIQEDIMRALSESLVNMIGLLSLDLDVGAMPEAIILEESRCSTSSFLPLLHAISLHDYSKATLFVAGRCVEFLRIRLPVDANALPELLASLKSALVPLRCLQICIAVSDLATAVAALVEVIRSIPSLRTLGIIFTFPTPRWSQNLLDAVEQLVQPLIDLRELVELGVALIPEPRPTKGAPPRLTNSIVCINTVHFHLPQLRLIEVQWEAREFRDGTLQPLLTRNYHGLMRRTWRYPNANSVA